MNFQKLVVVAVLWIWMSMQVFAQSVQTLRGTIVDDVTQSPLIGANIVIQNFEPLTGTVTDENGNFKFENLAVGSYSLKVSYLGYKEIILSNINLGSGKEVVLSIPMTEDVASTEEVVIKAQIDKGKPLNALATVSTRTFSVEETQKYAAAVNDPARMATSFAGVVSTDDGNNHISIRGNAPFGLRWRMEGIDIPSPNHFGSMMSAGGGVSILSAQLLSNSDFMTGAFPAEYGNTLAGVFDLRLRKGNNEKREYTIGAGVLGIDVAAEGPFSKKYNGSYLINYRYSTLSILSKIGVNIGDNINNFQDLSFNIYLPAGKAGQFTLFGFGGLSNSFKNEQRDSSIWESDYDRVRQDFISNTGAVGLKHQKILNNKAYMQQTLMVSSVKSGLDYSKLNDTLYLNKEYTESFYDNRIVLSSVLNYKISPKQLIRSGVYATWLNYSLNQQLRDEDLNAMETQIATKGNTQTLQAFTQWQYKANEHWTFLTGLHYTLLTLNKTQSIEPRASVQWQINDRHQWSLGYGLHGQMQPIGIYFSEAPTDNGMTLVNKNLKFNQSHHLVLAYQWKITEFIRFKTEAYYQHLYHLAVRNSLSDPTAVINEQYTFITDSLTNDGKGRNYGMEFTLEQYTHKNAYFLLSASVYDSKYKAMDGIWRNTRYNGRYSVVFTGGKSFPWTRKNRSHSIGLNMKLIWSGGLRTTPIDVDLSIENGKTEYIKSEMFTQRQGSYFRTDIKISYQRHYKKVTSTISLDIQNVSNRKNIFDRFYEAQKGEFVTVYQAPLIPILAYKLEF